LVFGEAADHSHPLRRRCDGHLPIQHRHRVGKTAHAVPPQFHIVVQAAAYDVKMVVNEPRQGTTAPKVNGSGPCTGKRQYFFTLPDCREFAVLDSNSTRCWIRTVERREQPSM